MITASPAAIFDPLAARACRSLIQSQRARRFALSSGFEPSLIFRNPVHAEIGRQLLSGQPIGSMSNDELLSLTWLGGRRMTPEEVLETLDDLVLFHPFEGDEIGCMERLAERESIHILVLVAQWALSRIEHEECLPPDVARELRRALDRAAPHDDDRSASELEQDLLAAASANRVRRERELALISRVEAA